MLLIAYISVSETTETTISAYIDGLDANWEQGIRYVHWYTNGSYQGVSSLPNKVSSGGQMTMTGLSPGTTYAIYVEVKWESPTGTETLATLSSSATTQTGTTRPPNWAWISTIAVGSPINISASEWNSFCTRINAFRAYKSQSAAAFTTVSSGQAMFTPVVQAYNAISSIPGRGEMPPAPTVGGAVTAYLFNQMRIALNAIA